MGPDVSEQDNLSLPLESNPVIPGYAHLPDIRGAFQLLYS